MDEIIFHILVPVKGVSSTILISCVINVVLPSVVVLGMEVLFLWNKKIPKRKLLFVIMALLSLVCLMLTLLKVDRELGLIKYIQRTNSDSDYIETHYVDPSQVRISFPEEKRNLVYIYVESLEDTYSDENRGGWFEENYIPRLTSLAEEGDNFSGNTGILNGAYSLPGTTWTMGALFGTTSGLPLKVPVKDNLVGKTGTFFPTTSVMGDILKQNGYRQIFLIGSDARFAGRDLYFEKHGEYELHDYMYALKEHRIPENYYEWWGFEDKKLFEQAKEELIEAAKGDEPFNLTILTADTHFPDGYLCEDCEKLYDSTYANVVGCCDKQVYEFIEWIKQQEFYDNTTVVVTGDHPTMDEFCDVVDSATYIRNVYSLILNSAVEPSDGNKKRDYSTLDLFPTTIAALGASIEGERLGLGTNLYSDIPTLLETDGYFDVIDELDMPSRFMTELSGIKEYSKDTMLINDELPSADITYNYDDNLLVISVVDFENFESDVAKVYLKIKEAGKLRTQKMEMERNADGIHMSLLNIGEWKQPLGTITVEVEDSSGRTYSVGEIWGDMRFKKAEYAEYLDSLVKIKEEKDISIFMTACGKSFLNVDSEIMEKLRRLGIATHLEGQNNRSYYAIIDGETVTEDMSMEALQFDARLESGVPYHVESQGLKYSEVCSILIKGKEYAKNEPGLNFVVWDNVAKKVIDSAVFD